MNLLSLVFVVIFGYSNVTPISQKCLPSPEIALKLALQWFPNGQRLV